MRIVITIECLSDRIVGNSALVFSRKFNYCVKLRALVKDCYNISDMNIHFSTHQYQYFFLLADLFRKRILPIYVTFVFADESASCSVDCSP